MTTVVGGDDVSDAFDMSHPHGADNGVSHHQLCSILSQTNTETFVQLRLILKYNAKWLR